MRNYLKCSCWPQLTFTLIDCWLFGYWTKFHLLINWILLKIFREINDVFIDALNHVWNNETKFAQKVNHKLTLTKTLMLISFEWELVIKLETKISLSSWWNIVFGVILRNEDDRTPFCLMILNQKKNLALIPGPNTKLLINECMMCMMT